MLRMILLASLFPAAALACGPETDCEVEGGTYRIALPDAPGPIPAIVYAHGYRGTAGGTMKDKGLRAMIADRGAALIALAAIGADWDLPNAPNLIDDGRDEIAYLDRVVADAVLRFGIDPARVTVTGFSAGGMFVWNAVCERGDRYAGYVAMSGTFWKEAPAGCPAPAASVVHIHGSADTTVPIHGRTISTTRQGDAMTALSMYAKTNGFGPPGAPEDVAGMTCKTSADAKGHALDFCLFAGGHEFSTERLAAALDLIGR